MLRKHQPARWCAVMVSARWRIVLGSTLASSAIVPAIQPAARRFALRAGCPAPWLRFDRGSGCSASGDGVPPSPACTRLRGITSSSAVVPPAQPIRRALCVKGRAGDTTASRCAQSGVFSQPARRGTAMPGSLTSARCASCWWFGSQQRDHVPP